MTPARFSAVFLVAFLLGAWPAPLHGQAARCVLHIEAPVKSSVGVPGSEGVYTTYLGGGTVTLRCGDAVMTGDSAVHFETERRAEMIGNTVYRDTTRTLEARSLTYFQASDEILAEGDVRLVRRSSGARLDGPRVRFFRLASPGSRSIATGRPRMTIPSDQPGGEPILVDADVAEFEGSEMAFARGNVVLMRSDFDATADSARFASGNGILHGEPTITSAGMRLEGDSISTVLVDGDLDIVHAMGNAHAAGDVMRLRSAEIRLDTEGGNVERAWAFGEGRSVAVTGRILIAGDSLDFAFEPGGDLDSLTATGLARGFQLREPLSPQDELEEPEPGIGTGADWIEGATLGGWFEPAEVGADERQMRRLLATGSARSLFSAVRDPSAGEDESRNYLIGSSIDVAFVGGEPDAIVAEQAIGVFLEPAGNSP